MKQLINKLYNWIDKKTKRTDGKTDYCSASPDVIFGVDISQACELHDFHYIEQDISKEQADIQLREDIIALGDNKFKFKVVGYVYYWAVKYLGVIYKW